MIVVNTKLKHYMHWRLLEHNFTVFMIMNNKSLDVTDFKFIFNVTSHYHKR